MLYIGTLGSSAAGVSAVFFTFSFGMTSLLQTPITSTFKAANVFTTKTYLTVRRKKKSNLAAIFLFLNQGRSYLGQ